MEASTSFAPCLISGIAGDLVPAVEVGGAAHSGGLQVPAGPGLLHPAPDPLLCLVCFLVFMVDTALLAITIASSLPLWRPELPSLFVSSVALLVVALWTLSLLWRLVELLVQAAFKCVLALVCYALPLIHHYTLSTFWSSWLMLALLAVAVTSLLPLWRPELPLLLLPAAL